MKFIISREGYAFEKPLDIAYEGEIIDKNLRYVKQESKKWFIDIDNLDELNKMYEKLEGFERVIIHRGRCGFPEIEISSSPY